MTELSYKLTEWNIKLKEWSNRMTEWSNKFITTTWRLTQLTLHFNKMSYLLYY